MVPFMEKLRLLIRAGRENVMDDKAHRRGREPIGRKNAGAGPAHAALKQTKTERAGDGALRFIFYSSGSRAHPIPIAPRPV